MVTVHVVAVPLHAPPQPIQGAPRETRFVCDGVRWKAVER